MTRRYLLDTGPAFDFLFQRRGIEVRAESARLNVQKIGICTPVLGEIVGGLEGSDSQKASWDIARKRLGKRICWPYDKIAAIALTPGNCTVVSMDSDLSAVPGLTVENWAVTAEGS